MRQLVVLLLALCLFGATSAARADGLPAFSGLQLHLDASTITLDDDAAVASWADVSGNGYVATQSDPLRQPTYKAGGINGVPSVYFAGPTSPPLAEGVVDEWSDVMSIDPGGNPLEAQTVFVVTTIEHPYAAGPQSDPAWAYGCCASLLSREVDGFRIGPPWNQGEMFVVEGYTGPFSAGGDFLVNAVEDLIVVPVEPGDPYTVHAPMVFDSPMILDITAGELRDWGTLVISGESDPFTYDNGKRVWHGDIAEIIMYDHVLSDVERGQVGYYLEQKYGLDTAYVPEPSTWLLLVTGLFGLGLAAWRRRKH